jgi:hypothetical protein
MSRPASTLSLFTPTRPDFCPPSNPCLWRLGMVQHHLPDYEWLERMLGKFRKSPASFDPVAFFWGVNYVASAAAHMADRSNNASEPANSVAHCTNDVQWCTEKYVILVPLCVQEAGSIWLPSSGRRGVADFILECPSSAACTVPFQNGNGLFRHSRR